MTLDQRFGALTAHRRAHSERVAALMTELASQHGLDVDLAALAGWGHDLAREMSRPELLNEADRLFIAVGPEERVEPLLLHGPVAAGWMEQAGMGTPAVWEAIRYHTTGAPSMGRLAQALFVADGVEPGRQYDDREALLDLAMADLTQGYGAVLRHTLAYLTTRGLSPHPNMLKAVADCAGHTR